MECATTRPVDPKRYFESVERGARSARARAGLPLSGDDQPLQSAVHHLSAHLRGARAAGRHELGAVHLDRRSDSEPARAVLHGVGEPMLVKNLPRMVRYLKDRGTYVLFNTNGTVLNERNGRALIEAELDELRVSFDAANAKSYLRRSRQELFQPHPEKRARVPRAAGARGHTKPRVSAWLTGLRETIEELPDFVRVAAETGVKEVYLQRLVFFNDNAIGKARPDQALYEQLSRRRGGPYRARRGRRAIARRHLQRLGRRRRAGHESEAQATDGSPWSLCRRPWTVMYFTANGRALPCCIAPFSQRGYENYTLGDATQQTLREIWTGAAYRDFRKALLVGHAAGGLRQLRVAMEPVTAAATAPRRGRRRRRHSDVQRSGIDRGRGRRASARMSSTASSWPTAAAATALPRWRVARAPR